MIVVRSKEFSRHTPDNLKKYKQYKDEDIDKMSRSQKMQAIDEEDATAASNTNKYAWKKAKKWGAAGLGAGAATGAYLAKSGGAKAALTGGAIVGAYGGLMGGAIGSVRGSYMANKEGHNRDERSLKLARRMDERSRATGKTDDDYEYNRKRDIQMRKAMEAARAAEANSAYAAYVR